MGIAFADIDDAVLETQEKLIKKGAFLDLQTDLSDHVAVREMWKGRQKKFDGGHPWRFDVQMDHNHSARAVGLFENDGGAINDTMKKGEIPVRHVNAHYEYDQREPSFQAGGHAIVDIVNTRYVGMMVSLYEYLEEALWSKPADSDDDKTPYGLAYYVTKSATEGFYGANPAGFASGKASISQLTYPRWANWTAQYVNITKEDLIRKMRKAHRESQFRSPVSHAQPDLGSMKNGIYANSDTIGLMEEILENQNMNLGNDLASKDGRTQFKSTPITYAPKLNDDTSDPVYMLDWKTLGIGVLAGWENNLSAPSKVAGKHLVRRVDLDVSLNMACTNLRKQTVISK